VGIRKTRQDHAPVHILFFCMGELRDEFLGTADREDPFAVDDHGSGGRLCWVLGMDTGVIKDFHFQSGSFRIIEAVHCTARTK
jgi:hypothetical protein